MMNRSPVFILGGAQSDFARNWNREGKHFSEIMRETVIAALESSKLEPKAIQSAHVANFAAELYAHQGQLGAFFLEVDPAFTISAYIARGGQSNAKLLIEGLRKAWLPE